MANSRSLFIPVKAEAKLHPSFRLLKESNAHGPARRAMDAVFQLFSDPDGNFVEQLQTTAFEARLWELYLFAVFHNHSFFVDRSNASPDFLLARCGVEFALEAVTSNPPPGVVFGPAPEPPERTEDLAHYVGQVMPIRLGSPLFSKMKLEYWKLPHVAGKPFVLAIAPFHDRGVQLFSDSALLTYLYGLDDTINWDDSGLPFSRAWQRASHEHGAKRIPSGFFRQPGSENVSAVLFSNSATLAKFNRMGYSHQLFPELRIYRYGLCYDADPRSLVPQRFHYEVGDPAFPESWGQGLCVYHNPNASLPLGLAVFDGFLQGYVETNGRFLTRVQRFHPITSITVNMSTVADSEGE